ncbi:MAG TPA: hypothetical protein VN903_28670 [Polyangia bacterium]|nr:hypothetical protein [Polyangia bacterium]
MSARVSNPECEQHSCPCYLDGDTWRCAACDIDKLERRLASLQRVLDERTGGAA